MNYILSLQGLAHEKEEGAGLMGHSTESNNCGNGNSGISVACPGK